MAEVKHRVFFERKKKDAVADIFCGALIVVCSYVPLRMGVLYGGI